MILLSNEYKMLSYKIVLSICSMEESIFQTFISSNMIYPNDNKYPLHKFQMVYCLMMYKDLLLPF